MKTVHHKKENAGRDEKLMDYYKRAKFLANELGKDEMEKEYIKRRFFDYFLGMYKK
jgi:hypothetical protein